jgi:EmrB/QacA subfamily drug resistance transporter
MTTSDGTGPASSAVQRPGSPRMPRPGLMLAFLCSAQFMVILDVSIVNVALPSIGTSLGIGEADLPAVVTTYGTVLGGCLLFGSRLADTFGRRRLLRIGLAIFGAASLTAGLTGDQVLLFVARGVQGLGAALIAPAALSTLTTTFAEGPARTRALGLWGALTGLAAVAGVVLGGLLSAGPGWRWIFFVNVPIALVAVLTAPAVLAESRGRRRRFDAAGAVLLTGGLLVLLHTLSRTIDRGWTDPIVLGGLAVTVVLLAVFGLVERRAQAPLVPSSIFRVPTLRAANLATMFLLGTVVTVFFFASLFLQQVLGYSPLDTGLAYLPLALIVAVGSGSASALVTRLPAKVVLGAGLLLVTTGLLLLARMPGDAAYPGRVLPAFLVVGLGMGLAFVPLQVAAQAGVDEHHAGLAAGLISSSQEVGGALGVAVAATIAFARVDALTAAAHGDPLLVRAARAGVFHQAFSVGAGFAVVALLISLLGLPRIPPAAERPVVA